jgi:hypothetical protein
LLKRRAGGAERAILRFDAENRAVSSRAAAVGEASIGIFFTC